MQAKTIYNIRLFPQARSAEMRVHAVCVGGENAKTHKQEILR